METLKKFWKYFLMFIGFFLLITLLTNFLMRDDYKNANYEIKAESPVIAVTECKAAYSNGYIKGSVTNNTEEIIPLKYLQINLYDGDDVYLGSEYKELKNFYPQETINFDIGFEYLNVEKANLSFVDEIPEKQGFIFNLFENVDDDVIKIAGPIGAFLVLVTIIP